MNITTNSQWRQFVYGYELSERELADFDYIDPEELPTHNFIRYRGTVIDPSEFMRITDTMMLHADNADRDLMAEWDGYMSDSYFSGLLIRYSDDCEEYQIATYTS